MNKSIMKITASFITIVVLALICYYYYSHSKETINYERNKESYTTKVTEESVESTDSILFGGSLTFIDDPSEVDKKEYITNEEAIRIVHGYIGSESASAELLIERENIVVTIGENISGGKYERDYVAKIHLDAYTGKILFILEGSGGLNPLPLESEIDKEEYISNEEAINIASSAIEGRFRLQEGSNVDLIIYKECKVVTFGEDLSKGMDYVVRVHINAYTGEVLEMSGYGNHPN